jgi:hypothetical protein
MGKARDLAGTTLANGTYTPTLTNGASMTASTAYVCQWSRVGNTVTVSGKADVTMSSGTGSALSLSLPVASNFASDGQAGGTWCSSLTANGRIVADAANDRITLFGTYASGSQTVWFNASYLIV